MKFIHQTESSECGLTCLAMVASHFGHHVDMSEMRRRFSVSLKGAALAQLMRHAAAMHLITRPLRLELEELGKLRRPAILHWNLNHFVVLKKVRKSLSGKISVHILDPAVGERKLSLDEVSRHFTGVALECLPTQQFEKKDDTRRVSIAALTGKVFGLRGAIIKVVTLALALEVFAIVAPLFNQFVIDEVIVSGDRELLKVLVLGFALLLITQTAIGLARSWFLMRWSLDVGLQWTTRIFTHMTRLPVSYFEKRHLGDIVSRFGSIGAIQSTLTSLFVESLLDGFMALFALAMMLMYSWKLTLVVLTSVLLYGLLRWVSYQPLREASHERLILSAKENSNFIETIRAITPLKLFGREAERTARWQNLKQDVVNRDVKTQKMGVMFKTFNTGISGIQGLVMFYIGATQVMENLLTVGMLMAFSSYAGTFSGRITNLIDLFVNVKMLGMHANRLADLVLEEPERDPVVEIDVGKLDPDLTLRNVKFRYGDGEPWVLNGINLHIPAGQHIALVGPSGAGKTTLCKILLGLLEPTEGEVFIGQTNIRQLGGHAYRQLVGTVMQDDVLLAGSIIDNISFFDERVDSERAEHCARMAAIHDEIAVMPMAYQTLVGDMGSSLSGGQKQRVLLARALYKQPRILALDEATSHLDVQNEQQVNAALAKLNVTRIMVAHRIETIECAERVVAIQAGKAVEVRAALLESAA